MSFIDIPGVNVQHRAGNLFFPGDGVPPIPPLVPPVVYDFVDGTETFTVPAGVTLISVYGWGGGGAGGFMEATGRDGAGMGGACGGYSSCDIPVTPGEVLTVSVAGGGVANSLGLDSDGGFNGGGLGPGAGNSPNYGLQNGGGGGGYSAILRGTDFLMLIGGGGGGGQIDGGSENYNDGVGGLLSSAAGSGSTGCFGGTGGNTSPRTGGNPGTNITTGTFGSDLLGGDGSVFIAVNYGAAGGGGGGYAGGGGGGVGNNVTGAGGGGGSSYFDVSCLNLVTTAGVKQTPANSGDPLNDGKGFGGIGGYGVGVHSPTPLNAGSGADGRIVIDWVVP